MRKIEKTVQEREAIVAEYLMGDTTYRKLEKKYNVDFRIIHSWVNKFQGKSVGKKITLKASKTSEHQEQLPTDVKQLREELRKAKLHNKLLNAIIDIAEDQLKIDIRKKSGTKR